LKDFRSRGLPPSPPQADPANMAWGVGGSVLTSRSGRDTRRG
jgi:hypothetical protein